MSSGMSMCAICDDSAGEMVALACPSCAGDTRDFPRIKSFQHPNPRNHHKWLWNLHHGDEMCKLSNVIDSLEAEQSVSGGCLLNDAVLVHLHRVGRYGSKYYKMVKVASE